MFLVYFIYYYILVFSSRSSSYRVPAGPTSIVMLSHFILVSIIG